MEMAGQIPSCVESETVCGGAARSPNPTWVIILPARELLAPGFPFENVRSGWNPLACRDGEHPACVPLAHEIHTS